MSVSFNAGPPLVEPFSKPISNSSVRRGPVVDTDLNPSPAQPTVVGRNRLPSPPVPAPTPSAMANLSAGQTRALNSIVSSIQNVMSRFAGFAQNADTQAQIRSALQDAGLSPERLRLTDANARTGSIQAQANRAHIHNTIMSAYNGIF